MPVYVGDGTLGRSLRVLLILLQILAREAEKCFAGD